ncbi:DUF4156 domain-containing protein [Thalassotalea sp. LPB0316]|uniref:DUF4156 domain-containing protein n=1 Tax=Thalassotalea sp. LPB0316 TaxID=2769490 RepID=UPI001865D0F1|nr:DUF4156 domain-containing protein [Thalassotalea sp. LPB0316]QOL25401.1 DUF4156 domain-containing protein [Thalassotalea sp. LPB0316]
MKRFYFTLLSMVIGGLMVGCATQKYADEASVSIVFDNTQLPNNCKKLGDVVGSAGTMISYWFIPETQLLLSAMDTLKQETLAIGGNIAYLRQNIDSNTAITLLGEAYFCDNNSNS